MINVTEYWLVYRLIVVVVVAAAAAAAVMYQMIQQSK